MNDDPRTFAPTANGAAPRNLSKLETLRKFQVLDIALKSIEDRLDQLEQFSVDATRQTIEHLADKMPVARQIQTLAKAFFEEMDATHPKKDEADATYQELVARVTACEARFKLVKTWLMTWEN